MSLKTEGQILKKNIVQSLHNGPSNACMVLWQNALPLTKNCVWSRRGGPKNILRNCQGLQPGLVLMLCCQCQAVTDHFKIYLFNSIILSCRSYALKCLKNKNACWSSPSMRSTYVTNKKHSYKDLYDRCQVVSIYDLDDH